MCGRLDQSHDMRYYLRAAGWDSVRNASEAGGKFNASPGTYRPVIFMQDGVPVADDRFWGYQASWAADKVDVAINARIAKLHGKYWAPLLKAGRAVVPADGWFEWTGPKGERQPHHIYRRDHAPLFIAAVGRFGPRREEDKPASAGFAIVTADSAGAMLDVHDRRPVVLSADDAKFWLDPGLSIEGAEQFLRAAALPVEAFAWRAIDKGMSRPLDEAKVAIQGPETIPVAD